MANNTESDVPVHETPLVEIEKRRRKIFSTVLAVPVVTLTLLSILSFVDKSFFVFNLITFILVFYIAALSLDLEVGSLGLPNFGKVGFIAIGAYGFVLTFSAGISILGDNFFPLVLLISIIVPIILSMFFGYILAIPTVKLRADYFAIMTIAGAEVIRFLLQNEKRYLWQATPYGPNQALISNKVKNILVTTFPFDQSINFSPIPLPDFIGVPLKNFFGWETTDFTIGTVFVWQIVMVVVFALISYLIYKFVEQIRNSPYGRTLRAIRDDDISVVSVGKDVAVFRWQVTVISAVICSIAGMMFAMTFSAFEHGAFRPVLTFQLFIFIIIGGLGNSRGALAGTALIVSYLNVSQAEFIRNKFAFGIGPNTVINLPVLGDIHIIGDIFRFLQIDMIANPDNSKWIILGILLILFLIYMPSGLIPEPKTDNGKYLKLLTKEERDRSDQGIARRQSMAEKERISLESRKNSTEE